MYSEIIVCSLIQDILMKRKYVVGIILILLLYTCVITYFGKVAFIQGDNGYSFKGVGMNLYKVIEGDNYVDLICDFSKGGKLIFQGETYEYNLSGYEGNYRLEIRYPDGGFTQYSDNTHTGVGSSTKYDTKFIIAAITAIKLSTSPKVIIFTLLNEFVGLGLLAFPKVLYDVTFGWIFKNAEPSDLYLFVSRIIGLVLILKGIYEINFIW